MSLQTQMLELGIEEHPFIVGNGFTKLFRVPAGTVIGQHRHNVGHDSILLLGEVVVHRPDKQERLKAPAIIYMPPHVEHAIEAVADSLWACNWPDVGVFDSVEQLEQSLIA